MKAQAIDLRVQTLTWYWRVLLNLKEAQNGGERRYAEIESTPTARQEVEKMLERLYPNAWGMNGEFQYTVKQGYVSFALAFKFYKVEPEIFVELTDEMIRENQMRYG